MRGSGGGATRQNSGGRRTGDGFEKGGACLVLQTSSDSHGELAFFVLDVDEGAAVEEGLNDVHIATTTGEVETGVAFLAVREWSCHYSIHPVDIDVGVSIEHVE